MLKYILKVYRKLLRYPRFRKLAKSFVDNYTSTNSHLIQTDFSQKFVDRYGLNVIHGPFKGLKYASLEAYGSKLMPKFMGTYEHELHHIIEELPKRKNYKHIIDIGAAEGYYAIGLAKLFPQAKVIAYETSQKGRDLIKEMSVLNNVQQSIQIECECTVKTLNQHLMESGLILCDCEGYELELLDPVKLPQLGCNDMIIELHDYASQGLTVSEKMKLRFENTHHITFINLQENKPIAHLKDFNKENILFMANEGRTHSIGWLFLEVK